MATKNTLPADAESVSVSESFVPVDPTQVAQRKPDAAEGGSYLADPARGDLVLLTPSASIINTRKVQDPVTGVITRMAIQE